MKNLSKFLFLCILLCSAMTLEERAEKTLYTTATPHGFLAGSTHFSDIWARDSLYASWGAMEMEFMGPVRGTIELLSKHQNTDGQIPLRIGQKNMFLKLLGISSEQGAVYVNDKSSDPAVDPNCLWVITLEKYITHTQDEYFLQQHASHLRDAMQWLRSQDTDNDGLIEEKPYGSWDDAIRKQGESTYSNVCYYGALSSAYTLTGDEQYLQERERVKEQIHNNLWNGNYFVSFTGSRVMDVPGNLLAIDYGLTTDEQSQRILQTITAYKEYYNEILPRTNYEHFSFDEVYLPFYFVGMQDYHNNGPYWLWIAALERDVRRSLGDQEGAQKIEVVMQKITLEGVYEIYDTQLMPLKRLFYNSEKDFSWAAGMILYNGSSLNLSQ